MVTLDTIENPIAPKRANFMWHDSLTLSAYNSKSCYSFDILILEFLS